METIKTTENFEERGLLRFLTCGSVDDGKSTLIGRLSYDTKNIMADTLNALSRTSQKRGQNTVDLSLVTDGLQAEREQGITIDVAYRYLSTGSRKYIVADAPGHVQYTRNMITAASTANLAIVLVDARKGVLSQTRRHSTITRLVGIPHLLVAVNKMDLVGYDEAVFEKIKSDYLLYFASQEPGSNGQEVRFLPLSALTGDMVVERGDTMAWYKGPTLMDILEQSPAGHTEKPEDFRFPVQFICRPQNSAHSQLADCRRYMGRVESGEIRVGNEVTILPSGRRSRIRDIEIGGRSVTNAIHEQSASLVLEDEIDISRGDMIVRCDEVPEAVTRFEAMVCWLNEKPLSLHRKYLIRHTTRETRGMITGITYRLDIDLQEGKKATGLVMNDIARITINVQQPLFVEPYAKNRGTGAFIIIDETTNDTVGAGMAL